MKAWDTCSIITSRPTEHMFHSPHYLRLRLFSLSKYFSGLDCSHKRERDGQNPLTPAADPLTLSTPDRFFRVRLTLKILREWVIRRYLSQSCPLGRILIWHCHGRRFNSFRLSCSMQIHSFLFRKTAVVKQKNQQVLQKQTKFVWGGPYNYSFPYKPLVLGLLRLV